MRKDPYSIDFSYDGQEFELVAFERDGSDLTVFINLGRICNADFIELKEEQILTSVFLRMQEHFRDVMTQRGEYAPEREEIA